MPTLTVRSTTTIWKPLLVCPHKEIATHLRAALQEVSTESVSALPDYPRMGTIASLVNENGCNICFIDVVTNPEHALLLISEVAPAAPVVALHNRNDADLILRCLRRGACEFLSEPAPEPLRSLFERLARSRSSLPSAPKGSVYTVVPGKPGSGASTIAAHLAIYARSAGVGSVLLVDGDPLTGSIGFMLKLKSEFHLGDVLRDWKRMDDDLWSRLTLPSFGVDVLLAPEQPGTRVDWNRQLSSEMLSFLRDRYELIVVDTPDARMAGDSGIASLSDEILMVSTNELAYLHAARRAVAYLDQTASERGRLRLILNRYTPATGLKREDVQKVLGVEPFAVMGNDYAPIQAAVLDGKPVPVGTRFGTSVQMLFRQLRRPGGGEKKPASNGWLAKLRGTRK